MITTFTNHVSGEPGPAQPHPGGRHGVNPGAHRPLPSSKIDPLTPASRSPADFRDSLDEVRESCCAPGSLSHSTLEQ